MLYVYTAHVSGAPFPWRDSQKPKQILEGLAARYGWGKVVIEPVLDQNGEESDWTLALLGRTYSLAAFDEAAKTVRRTEARARAKLERQKLQKQYEAEGLEFINLGASNSSLDAIAITSDTDLELEAAASFAEPDSDLLGAPDERLALHVMRDPSFPLELVTEHVETRPLYSALQEDIEQVCNGERKHLWATKCKFLYYSWSLLLSRNTVSYRARFRCGWTYSRSRSGRPVRWWISCRESLASVVFDECSRAMSFS